MLFECEIALFRFEEGREGIRSWVELEKREGIREKLYAHARTTKAMAEEESARQFRAASLSFTVTITLAPPPVPRPFDRLRTREKQCDEVSFSRRKRVDKIDLVAIFIKFIASKVSKDGTTQVSKKVRWLERERERKLLRDEKSCGRFKRPRI